MVDSPLQTSVADFVWALLRCYLLRALGYTRRQLVLQLVWVLGAGHANYLTKVQMSS